LGIILGFLEVGDRQLDIGAGRVVQIGGAIVGGVVCAVGLVVWAWRRNAPGERPTPAALWVLTGLGMSAASITQDISAWGPPLASFFAGGFFLGMGFGGFRWDRRLRELSPDL
jgi:hypothetical protein